MNAIASGIYPVMITPFSKNGGIDFEAVDRLTEFYIQNGCHGIFAVCQ
ncbi:MAG: dihydrodipicolinate synthase family protein, partial [Clostridia bacterium]|nr:dihydrodipicolinate synthase family protein [Clostridia bacterium]